MGRRTGPRAASCGRGGVEPGGCRDLLRAAGVRERWGQCTVRPPEATSRKNETPDGFDAAVPPSGRAWAFPRAKGQVSRNGGLAAKPSASSRAHSVSPAAGPIAAMTRLRRSTPFSTPVGKSQQASRARPERRSTVTA